MQTYSMSDNKVSSSRERCWLSNRVQLLETKVTALWLRERETVGPDRDSFATWLCIGLRYCEGYMSVFCRCVFNVGGNIIHPHPFGAAFPESEHCCC